MAFSQKVEELRYVLVAICRDIKDSPYLCLFWMKRGTYLFQLGYPELSAADGYKSILLCNAGLDFKSSLGEVVRFSLAMFSLCVDGMIQADKSGTTLRRVVKKLLLQVRQLRSVDKLKSVFF